MNPLAELGAQIIGAAVSSLFVAFLLQLLTARIAGFRPDYHNAFLASFAAYMASVMLVYAGQALRLWGVGLPVIIAGSLILLVLVQSTMFHFLVRSPIRGRRMRFGHAVTVASFQLVLGAGATAAIAVAFLQAGGFTRGVL